MTAPAMRPALLFFSVVMVVCPVLDIPPATAPAEVADPETLLLDELVPLELDPFGSVDVVVDAEFVRGKLLVFVTAAPTPVLSVATQFDSQLNMWRGL